MIEYLLSISSINISNVVLYKPGGGWTNETNTIYHIISSSNNISEEICEMILSHPSFNVDVLNIVDHDDYRPLDLADEYNPNIVNLLESKGAIRHWRVGPGFKPKDNYPIP